MDEDAITLKLTPVPLRRPLLEVVPFDVPTVVGAIAVAAAVWLAVTGPRHPPPPMLPPQPATTQLEAAPFDPEPVLASGLALRSGTFGEDELAFDDQVFDEEIIIFDEAASDEEIIIFDDTGMESLEGAGHVGPP